MRCGQWDVSGTAKCVCRERDKLDERKVGIMSLLFKKGNKLESSSYHGITRTSRMRWRAFSDIYI